MRSVYLLLAIFSISCTSYGRDVKIEVHGASYCLSSSVHYQGSIPSDSKVSEIMNDPSLNARFSKKSIRLAVAYNIWEELEEFVKLEKKVKGVDKEILDPEYVKLESKIYRRIQLMSQDIQATTSEFSCYVDRFNEILAFMQEEEDDIIQNNSLYAIISGAIFSMIDGATIYDNPTNQLVILTGGIVVAYFSYQAFKPNIVIEFKPKSSNLKEIWYKPEKSVNFSSALWFVMTRELFADDPPIREVLLKRWIENGFLGKENKKERDFHINLFFGTGGLSSITHISNRREMNNEVKTMIQLLEQDVNAFHIELVANH